MASSHAAYIVREGVRIMRRIVLAVCLLVLMAGFLWNAPLVAQAVRDGLALCAGSVIPALFPFFAAVSCFTDLGLADDLGRLLSPVTAPLLGCSGAGSAAFVLGLLGGYPVGGRTAAELYRSGVISRAEAEHLLTFCNNCGPSFVLGVAGAGCFGSIRIGLWLYAIHILSAVAVAQIRRSRGTDVKPPSRVAPAPSLPAALVHSVTSGASTMISVCAFVVFSVAFTRLITALTGLNHPVLIGAVELTGGVLRLTPDRPGFVMASALLGWGGLCVHGQTAAALRDTDLSLRPHLLGKSAQAVISAALALLAGRFLF